MSVLMAATRSLLYLFPRTTRSEQSVRREIAKRGTEAAPVPRVLRRVAVVTETTVEGQRVVRITPRRGATGAHLLWTCGGAYVYPALRTHWALLARLVRASGVTVTVPLYGLAPEHDVDDAVRLLDAVHDGLRAEGADVVHLGGDSAGGALALAQAMRHRDTGRPAAASVLLVSPWLDATLSHPEVPWLADLDPMLGRDGLVAAGAWWAGARDRRDPLVSPLFGDLTGLPPVFAYQGDRDLLVADAKELARGVGRVGGRIQLRLYRGAFHVFVGAPWTREARRATAHLAGVLRGAA
jgi:monoterpene epsilon-lactone hydrolase